MLDSIFRALSELPDFIKNGTSSAVIFTILSSFLIWITRDIIAKFIFAKINYNPVSYTHLDVYKRQADYETYYYYPCPPCCDTFTK